MDIKSLLQSFDTIAEDSKVHKGTYGTSYGKEDVRDQYGHKIGKVNKDAEAKKDEPKKGRGRPKKGAGASGEDKTYDSSALSAAFGGKKPSKEVGKRSVKHSLKEYIEEAETAINEDMNSQAPVEIKPASQTQTQVIQQGNKTIGTVNNPQLAAQIKQSIGKGEMTLAGDELGEEFDKPVKTNPAEKGKYEGKSKQELLKAYNHLKKTGPHEKGSKAYGNMKELAFAIRAKGDWGKVQEVKDLPGKQDKLDVAKPKGKLDAKDFAALRSKKQVKESQIMKIVEGINFKELMATADSEVQEMLIELQNDVELFKDTGHASDLLDSFLKVHLHHNKNKITDEGSIEDHTQHGLDATPSKFVAVDPNPAPTSFKVDPIQATTDRMIGGAEKAGSFLKNLVAPKKTFESNTMKDIQLENWEKELNSLLKLNEGITVSSSTGQQGSPDSVSVNATDADAQQLLQVLRQAGVGVFGGEEAHSDYGAPMNGDTEGHGTEPELSPTVVGDGDDMMALIKKMTGIQDSGEEHGEQPGTLEPAGEEGNDYEDEEGHGSDGHSHEEEEEVTDEGNAFSGAVAKAKQDGIQPGEKINVGGKQYPVKEEGMGHEHEHEDHGTCNECGMYEARCVCEPGEEQVEENFANEPDEEMAMLKQLLGQGGDLHRQKHSQAVGNPTQVTFETKLLKDSSNLLTDWKKLSGIK